MPVASAEMIIAVGAAVLVVVSWLLTGVLLRQYSISELTMVLAAGALGAVYFHRQHRGSAWTVPYETILVVIAGALVAVAVYHLIFDLLTWRDFDLGSVLGRLGFYGGVAVIAFGAYQIWLQRRRAF